MRSELLKVRSMPTPRWTLIALLVCLALGIGASVAWGVGEDAVALDLAVSFPTFVGSLVFGVWMAGVEFGQDTLRRTLAADPGRLRMVFSKLAVALIVIVVTTVGLMVAGGVLFDLAGSSHPESIDPGQAARMIASTLLSNLIVAVIGMGLTLLTRSMAGGLTITLIFFFVLDTALSFAPKVGDYSLGTVTGDLDSAIRGTDEVAFGGSTTHEPAIAALLTFAWLAVLFGAGIMRTLRSDVK